MNDHDLTAPIGFSTQGSVAIITLNRPQARNALTPRMICELADVFVRFRDDASLRVAVLAAAGDKVFCAGGDLALTLPLLGGSRAPETPWDHRVLNEPWVMAASGLRDFELNKPVIAAVQGACLAGGMELVLGTDIRVATDNAMFGLPEVTRALIPFAGSMVRLPRQIPQALAMELLLTGQPISAQQALQWGLINRVVNPEQLMETAMSIARTICANGPVAVRAIKEVVRNASGLPLQAGYELENRARTIVFESDDAVEGPKAFMEKRPAQYRGS